MRMHVSELSPAEPANEVQVILSLGFGSCNQRYLSSMCISTKSLEGERTGEYDLYML